MGSLQKQTVVGVVRVVKPNYPNSLTFTILTTHLLKGAHFVVKNKAFYTFTPCRRPKLKIVHVFTHFDEDYIKQLDLSWELLCFISIIYIA